MFGLTFVRRFLLPAAVAVWMTAPVWPQASTGQASGTVRDQTGGVMARVPVTITNRDTNESSRTTTNGEGYYNAGMESVGNGFEWETQNTNAAYSFYAVLDDNATSLYDPSSSRGNPQALPYTGDDYANFFLGVANYSN
jgi:hypothetical protein